MEETFNANIPDTTNGDFFCTLCLASANSEQMWSSHIAGKRHLKNVQKYPNGLPKRNDMEDSYDEPPAKYGRYDDDEEWGGYGPREDELYMRKWDYVPEIRPKVIDYGHTRSLHEPIIEPVVPNIEPVVPKIEPFGSTQFHDTSSKEKFEDQIDKILAESKFNILKKLEEESSKNKSDEGLKSNLNSNNSNQSIKEVFYDDDFEKELDELLKKSSDDANEKQKDKALFSPDVFKKQINDIMQGKLSKTESKQKEEKKLNNADHKSNVDQKSSNKTNIVDHRHSNDKDKKKCDKDLDKDKKRYDRNSDKDKRHARDSEKDKRYDKDFDKDKRKYSRDSDRDKKRYDRDSDRNKKYDRSSSRNKKYDSDSDKDHSKGSDRNKKKYDRDSSRNKKYDTDSDSSSSSSSDSDKEHGRDSVDYKRKHDKNLDTEKNSRALSKRYSKKKDEKDFVDIFHKINEQKLFNVPDTEEPENSSSSWKKSSVKDGSKIEEIDPDNITPDKLDDLLSSYLKPKANSSKGKELDEGIMKNLPENDVKEDDPETIAQKLESLPTKSFFQIVLKKMEKLNFIKDADELKMLLKIISQAQAVVCKNLPTRAQALLKAKMCLNDSQKTADSSHNPTSLVIPVAPQQIPNAGVPTIMKPSVQTLLQQVQQPPPPPPVVQPSPPTPPVVQPSPPTPVVQPPVLLPNVQHPPPPIVHPFLQPTYPMIQTVPQTVMPTFPQSFKQTVPQSVAQTVSQPFLQTSSQFTSQTVAKLTSQPVSTSFANIPSQTAQTQVSSSTPKVNSEKPPIAKNSDSMQYMIAWQNYLTSIQASSKNPSLSTSNSVNAFKNYLTNLQASSQNAPKTISGVNAVSNKKSKSGGWKKVPLLPTPSKTVSETVSETVSANPASNSASVQNQIAWQNYQKASFNSFCSQMFSLYMNNQRMGVPNVNSLSSTSQTVSQPTTTKPSTVCQVEQNKHSTKKNTKPR